jgi:stearoyl-CoA desaturase (delta-9 desaturase)
MVRFGDPDMIAAPSRDAPPRLWTQTLTFGLTLIAAITLVPWYGIAHGYHAAAWIAFALLLGANGMAITCGYHRLFSHATYEAHPVLKVLYLLFGAMALQNSVLIWSAGHRVHHRHIDEPEIDPYCARRGFWFSHIGWMLHDYPSGQPDFATVRDLERDPLVRWQHRHYLAIALGMNLGLPLLIGLLCGQLVGVFLLAGVLRLVVSHHTTFCINSLAHMWGTQPYTDQNTARDNGLVSLLTYGEGYHNFHHQFAHDYRNGVRWWQWDPSKWFISAMRGLGLAYNLKRIPWFKIQGAKLDTLFRRAEERLAHQEGLALIDGTDHRHAQLEQFRKRVGEEYSAFRRAVNAWGQLREQAKSQPKLSALRKGFKDLEQSLRLQYRRMQLLAGQQGWQS